VWVRRPFDSRIETWRGAPPGQERLSVRQSAFGVLASSSSGSPTPLHLTAPPSLASGDLRVDAAISEALRDRLIERRERREVYGRECQVYRAGGTITAGDIQRYVPDKGEYADFCMDRNGLVIEEMWTSKNELLRRRVATTVKVDPALDQDLFAVKTPRTPGVDPGAVDRIDRPTDRAVWTLRRRPKGFEALGRYSVTISSAAIPQQQSPIPIPGPTSTTEVYIRGPDLLVVDQDPSLAGLVKSDTRPKRRVKLPRLRNGELIIDGRMSEVRGETKDGSIVRVFGTLPPSELLKLANELRPPGG
jgi:hypothetical protein